MRTVDPRSLRDAFGRYMTGVTVVTTLDENGQPVGFTANSFSSVSLDPPLLLVCPGKFLSSYESFLSCERFCVSVLSEDQRFVANTFAGYKGDRFAQVDHAPDAHGVPVISGALARFSCKTHKVVPAGDHVILMGEVTGFDQEPGAGLGYAGGQFFTLGLEHSTRDPAARRNVAGTILKFGNKVLLEQTPEGLRPPTCAVQEKAAARDTLNLELKRLGVGARLGPVYSVFEDPEQSSHFAYLLAEVLEVAADSPLVAVEIDQLSGISCASPAVTSMLTRFARETANQNFNLYLGDSASGEIHTLSGGA